MASATYIGKDMIYQWENRKCADMDINKFFDEYEENLEIRKQVDALCISCQYTQRCNATALSKKETGVWGGIYFVEGKVSAEFNSHKTNEDWYKVWSASTM